MVDRKTNPKDLNDDELEDRYRSAWHIGVGNYGAEATFLSIEINRRLLEEGAKENGKLSVENNKLSKRGVKISSLALFIALTSAVFSFIDWREDGAWQSEQIIELTQIVNQLEQSNKLLTQIFKVSKNEAYIEEVKKLNEVDERMEHSNVSLAKKTNENTEIIK